MNLPLPATRRNWPRRLVNALVALVVLAVAAGAFVLSYPGVHAIASRAGVSPHLAQLYPGLLDAVFVVACVAAVMLREAAWWARFWAWVVFIAMLAAIGATNAANAMNYALPHPLTEGVVAAVPAVAVLLAFSLLLTMLRYSRAQAAAIAPGRETGSDAGQGIADAAVTGEEPAPAGTADGTDAAPGRDFAGVVPDLATPQDADSTQDADGPPRAAPAAAPASRDYWDTDEDRQFAGQVYPIVVAEPDELGASPTDSTDGTDGAVGQPAIDATPAEIDQDAPPFATAPFAKVPRLNRARVTPTPPSDDRD